MSGKDYYDILGISKNASESDIKRAYRKLAKQYHPDVNKSAGAEERFKEINAAYEVLGDSQKRAQYDQFGSSPDGGFGGFQSSTYEGNPFDIFNSFFNQGGGGGFGFEDIFSTDSGEQQYSTQHYQDRITISFLEAVRGTTHKYTYNFESKCDGCGGRRTLNGDPSYVKKCPACKGSGVEVTIRRTALGSMQTRRPCRSCRGDKVVIEKPCRKCRGSGFETKSKTVVISIPVGVQDGKVVSFWDKSGITDKKISLVVSVETSPIFTRKDYDIHTKIYINPFIAIFGGTVEIPSPTGIKTIRIQPGVKAGDRLKIKGAGISTSVAKGDLVGEVVFGDFPKMTKEQRDVLESLAKVVSPDTVKWIEKAKKHLGG